MHVKALIMKFSTVIIFITLQINMLLLDAITLNYQNKKEINMQEKKNQFKLNLI